MPNYIAVVHKEPASDYGVSFPDFPCCITAGKTIDEAKDLAYEALLLHWEGLREDGEPLPAPTNLEDIVADPENADAMAFLVVSVPDAQGKAKRINITIPEETLRRVDSAAKRRGLSRSSFLTRAAQEVMEQERNPTA
jgi:predicted RNase H-like HicB family nuclease/predicted DNA binding CopG/RHH family protein